MKILHINTFTRGGAAAAAVKVHRGLLGKGVASKILSQVGEISQSDIETYRCDLKSRNAAQIWNLLREKAWFRLIGSGRQSGRNNFEIFTYPYSAYNVVNHPLVKEADIIHLHWVANLVDYPAFFREIDKPVVWTLHDMNPFLGGFHYENDERLNSSVPLKKIDQRLKRMKRDVFLTKKNITIVGPSAWMTNMAKSSQVFGESRHIQIPYAVDTNVFTPEDKLLARKALGLSPEGIIFTFISDNVHIRRKGFLLLREAIEKLRAESAGKDILIVKIGSGPANIDGILDMGRINDLKTMALALSASDALILPSLEDNFPNVMLEANACGCPVIGFPVGGIKEYIKDAFNGLLADEISSQALARSLRLFALRRGEWDSAAIREYVIGNYAMDIQASRYLDLYRILIAEKS